MPQPELTIQRADGPQPPRHAHRFITTDLRASASENGLAQIAGRLTSFEVRACPVCGARSVAYAGPRITAAQRRELLAFAQSLP